MTLIKMKNACVDFTLSRENVVHALQKINFTVENGEFVAVTGKSGSGKSTLLNCLGGLGSLTSGEYWFGEKNISKLNAEALAEFRNKNIGFIVQHFALIPDMTVFKNIALPLRYAKQPKAETKRRVEELCMQMEIEDKIYAYPNQLSGGQCQRVAIARALACSPSLLLADEPTGALDEQTSINILQIFKKLNQQGMTIIMVTHDEAIAKSCSHIVNIKDGIITNI